MLLSSCPNTKKNTTGGVSIHREWSSCIKLYFENKAKFDEYGFKSNLFEHETLCKEYEDLAKYEAQKEKMKAKKEADMNKSDKSSGKDSDKEEEDKKSEKEEDDMIV